MLPARVGMRPEHFPKFDPCGGALAPEVLRKRALHLFGGHETWAFCSWFTPRMNPAKIIPMLVVHARGYVFSGSARCRKPCLYIFR